MITSLKIIDISGNFISMNISEHFKEIVSQTFQNAHFLKSVEK